MKIFPGRLFSKGSKNKKQPINLIDASRRHLRPVAKFTILALLAVFLILPINEAYASGSLTSVKDTLASDRPSVLTTISSTITAGDTTINIGSTIGIVQGDTVTICNAGCSTTENKVVSAVLSSTQLALTVGATNTYSSGTVALKITSKHVVTFTTRSTVSGGKFLVSIPATNTTTPIAASFALNGITTATATEYTLTGATFTTMSTSTSASNVVFTFNFSGSVASNTAISITMGNTNPLINPTKTAAQGTADISSVIVTEQDGSSNVIDTTTVDIGTIESVAVSATVSPALTFTINGLASGTSVTAHNTTVTTTSTTVPFSTLTINASSTAAQFLHVDTNSNSGYAVTVQQDGCLRKTNGTCIVDFSSTAAAEHDGTIGFGYALQSKAGAPTLPFNYNDSSRKFNAIGFSSTTPATVMSNTGAANGDETYVDYYVEVNAQQAQGTYQNLITYIATATY